jgi:hypothetical protein
MKGRVRVRRTAQLVLPPSTIRESILPSLCEEQAFLMKEANEQTPHATCQDPPMSPILPLTHSRASDDLVQEERNVLRK